LMTVQAGSTATLHESRSSKAQLPAILSRAWELDEV
jgi:hypothetical protein